MSYLFVVIFTVLVANSGVHSSECRTVKKGAHYASLIPFYGLKSEAIISTRVKFTNSSARYVFPSSEARGHWCMISWNKLWGACRCGYLANNHQDSDRFVFRRPESCIRFDPSGYVVGEDNDCPERDLIILAAYAYDNGLIPKDHEGILIKEFSTKLQVDTWYKLTLIFEVDKTTYQLFDKDDQFLESKEIAHRQCKDFKLGAKQDLYFGGQCPAPQAVTVCFDQA